MGKTAGAGRVGAGTPQRAAAAWRWGAALVLAAALAACGGGHDAVPAAAQKRGLAAAPNLAGSVPAARPLFGSVGAEARFDLNADGRTDLLWTNAATGETVAWLMNGSALVAGNVLLQHPSYRVIGAGDLSGDGKSDLLWYDHTQDVTATWLMDGTSLTRGRALLLNQGFALVGTPDLDGDGQDDLLWHDATGSGRSIFWLMDGADIVGSGDLPIDRGFAVVALPDLNGDGRTDLVWHNPATGESAAWLMNGRQVIGQVSLLTHPGFRVVHAPDLNGDGKSDLLWHDPATGQTVAWLMDGLALTGGGQLLADPNFKVVATPDLNGDGRADLLWYSIALGQTVAWLMDGMQLLGGGGLLTDPDFQVVGTPDLDGNGRADLVWYSAASGQTATWLMNGSLLTGGGVLLSDPMYRLVAAPPAFPLPAPNDPVFSSRCNATPSRAGTGPLKTQPGDCFMAYRWTEAEMTAYRTNQDESLRSKVLDDVRVHLSRYGGQGIDSVIVVLDLDRDQQGNLPFGINHSVQPCSPHQPSCERFGRLGNIWLTTRDYLAYGPSLHELAHGFLHAMTPDAGSQFLVPTTVPAHWGFSSAGGQLGGWDRHSLEVLGGGQYRARGPLPLPQYEVPSGFGTIANGGNAVPYSNLELWAMGLIPDELLGPVDVAENPSFTGVGRFSASAIRTYTGPEVIARALPAARPSARSPRAFRGLVVLVTTQDTLPQQTVDELNRQIEYFSARAPTSTSFGLYNFWEATGGRASLHLANVSGLIPAFAPPVLP